MHWGKPEETVILDLATGLEKKLNFSLGGIIVDARDNTLRGTLKMDDKKKNIVVDLFNLPALSEVINTTRHFTIENDGYGDAAKTILTDSLLIIAHYHNIATGCSVKAYDCRTGEIKWKGDVKQIMTAHSIYYNIVHLTLYKNKLILEGNEAHGSYLQVLDLNTGKNLFSLMPDKN